MSLRGAGVRPAGRGVNAGADAAGAVPAVLRHDNLAAPTYELRRSSGRQLTGAVSGKVLRGGNEKRPQSAAVAVGSDPRRTRRSSAWCGSGARSRVRGWRATAAAGPAAPPREYGAVADQIDAGNYSEAYEATNSFFRESVTAEEFRDSMEERPALLGAFGSRTLSSTRRLTVARWTTSCSSSTPPTSCDRTSVSGSPRCRRPPPGATEFIIVTMSPLPHGNIGGRCATEKPPALPTAAGCPSNPSPRMILVLRHSSAPHSPRGFGFHAPHTRHRLCRSILLYWMTCGRSGPALFPLPRCLARWALTRSRSSRNTMSADSRSSGSGAGIPSSDAIDAIPLSCFSVGQRVPARCCCCCCTSRTDLKTLVTPVSGVLGTPVSGVSEFSVTAVSGVSGSRGAFSVTAVSGYLANIAASGKSG